MFVYNHAPTQWYQKTQELYQTEASNGGTCYDLLRTNQSGVHHDDWRRVIGECVSD
jgi:hypothetical protein